MTTLNLTAVAINPAFDIIDRYGADFAAHAPGLTVLRPEEVTDPGAVDVVLTFRPPADTFTPYPNLIAACSVAAGVDAILACPSLPDGLPVLRVEDPDQAQQMAGFAAFHVLWHHRRMYEHVEDQVTQDWNRPFMGRSPAKIRIGIMGFGLMGRAIAKALVALGYPVASLSRRAPDPVEPGVTPFLETDRAAFLGQSDILINVLPLTEATRNVIDADLLAALPAGASLINLGRGEHLDDEALIDALASGQIAAASLDAFAVEPLAKGHPYWSHPRVLITPHTASAPEGPAIAASLQSGLSRLLAGQDRADRAARGY